MRLLHSSSFITLAEVSTAAAVAKMLTYCDEIIRQVPELAELIILISSYLILSYLILSYLILSYLILSYHIFVQHKTACLRVTSLLAVKDMLWVGTSAGVIVTLVVPPVSATTTKV